MQIMSFNTQHCLNFLSRQIDYPLMAETILRFGPDIVGLNEMRDQGSAPEYEDQTGQLARLTGMHHCFAQAIGYDGVKPYGNGLLSRLPILSAQTILIPDPVEKTGPKNYETRCLLKARLQGGLTVLVVHMGLNTDEQQLAVQTILEHMEKERCILMGDFNAEPEDPVLQPLWQVFRDTGSLLEGSGHTFPSVDTYKKIDYILTTPDLIVRSAQVPQVVASDHFPILAELALKTE